MLAPPPFLALPLLPQLLTEPTSRLNEGRLPALIHLRGFLGGGSVKQSALI